MSPGFYFHIHLFIHSYSFKHQYFGLYSFGSSRKEVVNLIVANHNSQSIMNMKRKLLVPLIIMAIIGSIGCYLYVNDIIYFSGKDVKGIYVEEELRIVTDYYHGISYCKLLKKAIDGNQKDIKKLILLEFSGAGEAGYDHGNVLVKLIDRLGEETIISSLGSQLTKEEKESIEAYLRVGLEYGSNPHHGQTLDVSFPLLNQYLQNLK